MRDVERMSDRGNVGGKGVIVATRPGRWSRIT